jgi:hypothetical protein
MASLKNQSGNFLIQKTPFKPLATPLKLLIFPKAEAKNNIFNNTTLANS